MAVTVSREGGFLKVDDDTATNPEYVNLFHLEPIISGNNVTVELGIVLDSTTINAGAFADAEAFCDQLGAWVEQANIGA